MNFSLSWFDFCVTVNSPKTKCCGRKGDNRWFYNWSGVIVTKYGRKVTPVQKPPCSLADSCCVMISLWCKEGIKLDAVWSCHYSCVFLCTVPSSLQHVVPFLCLILSTSKCCQHLYSIKRM